MKWINVICVVVAVANYSSYCLCEGQELYRAQLQKMNQEVVDWHNKESILASMKEVSIPASQACYQSDEFRWPRKAMRVLQLATGVSTSDELYLPAVNSLVAGLRRNDPKKQEEFVKNFKEFLTTEFKYGTKDFNRRECLKKMDEMCSPYRPKMSKKHFDFYDAISELTQIKKAENIDDDKFYREVIGGKNPITSVYSAAFFCQYIDRMLKSASYDSDKEFKLGLPPTSIPEIDAWYYPSHPGSTANEFN